MDVEASSCVALSSVVAGSSIFLTAVSMNVISTRDVVVTSSYMLSLLAERECPLVRTMLISVLFVVVVAVAVVLMGVLVVSRFGDEGMPSLIEVVMLMAEGSEVLLLLLVVVLELEGLLVLLSNRRVSFSTLIHCSADMRSVLSPEKLFSTVRVMLSNMTISSTGRQRPVCGWQSLALQLHLLTHIVPYNPSGQGVSQLKGAGPGLEWVRSGVETKGGRSRNFPIPNRILKVNRTLTTLSAISDGRNGRIIMHGSSCTET
uniref:Uncharacterized protein n=1 Tax=Anopheles atroparvus TaxID=41427 RepID=A0A182J4F7_ANOAO